jgi:hypothetical protein
MSVAELQEQHESAHLGITTTEASVTAGQRKIKRKQDVPKANKRAGLMADNMENDTSKVALTMSVTQDQETKGESKKNLGLIEFTQQTGEELKKSKKERYLTISGLLSHPYFITINESDISTIIDEFERLTNSGDEV